MLAALDQAVTAFARTRVVMRSRLKLAGVSAQRHEIRVSETAIARQWKGLTP